MFRPGEKLTAFIPWTSENGLVVTIDHHSSIRHTRSSLAPIFHNTRKLLCCLTIAGNTTAVTDDTLERGGNACNTPPPPPPRKLVSGVHIVNRFSFAVGIMLLSLRLQSACRQENSVGTYTSMPECVRDHTYCTWLGLYARLASCCHDPCFTWQLVSTKLHSLTINCS